MNIFFLHKNPEKAAKMHANKHVVKMILETTQLLYGVHWVLNGFINNLPLKPYKLTHKNHPSSIWVRNSINNYLWLCKLGLELCKEYTYRYGKIHKCQEHIRWLILNIPTKIPQIPRTSPKLAMPNKYKSKNFIKSYRRYYANEKRRLLQYKKRLPPNWLVKKYNCIFVYDKLTNTYKIQNE